MVRSAPVATGAEGVIGLAVLLPVLLSPAVVVVPVNGVGVVPAEDALGVTGTWIVLLAPAAIGPGLTHVTV